MTHENNTLNQCLYVTCTCAGELDSYMFQTGHEGIHLYAEAMGLPLYQATTNGILVTKDITYHPCNGYEVKDVTCSE